MVPIRKSDPTLTAGIVRGYSAEITRRLTALERVIRTSLVTNDALGLKPGLLRIQSTIDPAAPGAFFAVDPATAIRRFTAWLSNAITTGVLEDDGQSTPRWLQTYVRAAYTRGVETASASVNRQIPEAVQQSVRSIMAIPFHTERLGAFFERNFAELKGITAEMSTKIQRALADGMAIGQGPKEIAREMAKVIDISKKRARKIARTEVIRANAEAQLNTFERFGLEEAAVEAEWITAGDGRVCPECAPKDGKIYTIGQARGMIPLHPQCRCSWVPAVKKQSLAA